MINQTFMKNDTPDFVKKTFTFLWRLNLFSQFVPDRRNNEFFLLKCRSPTYERLNFILKKLY